MISISSPLPSRVRKILVLPLFIFLSSIPAHAESVGPAPIKNHHPFYVGLLLPPPESATITHRSELTLSIDHSNIFLLNRSGRWAVFVDKELTELNLSLRHRMSERWEFGLEAPLYFSGRGALDNFIRWWHTRFGLVSYQGQKETPDFRYIDSVTLKGEPFTEGEEGAVAMGDITLSAKLKLFALRRTVTSLQLLFDAPTGDYRKGTGSGNGELGARLLTFHDFEPFYLHTGLGFMIPGKRRGITQEYRLSSFAAGFVALEWAFSDTIHLTAQSSFNESPAKDVNVYQFSRPYVDLTLGATYRASERAPLWRFAFSENMNRTAPDFTIHLSVTAPFGFGE